MPSPASDTPCLRCGGAMEEGFLLDYDDHAHRRQARWVEGKPVDGWFMGPKTKDRAVLRVEARRCRACGGLDLCARDP